MAENKTEAADELDSPYVGYEDDDLSDMTYPSDDRDPPVETHPPETKEEAEQRAEMAASAKKQSDEEEAEDSEAEEEAETAEAEETEESEAEGEEEESEEHRIPYDRFKQVNDRAKEAEAEAKRLREKLERYEESSKEKPEETPEFDFDAKEAEAVDALLEGETEKYKTVRREIREAEKSMYLREAERVAKQSDESMREAMTFEETAAALEREFPQINEADKKNFDSEARDEVLELYEGYARSGRYTQAAALDKAVRKVARFNQWGQEAKEPDDPKKVVDIKKADVKKKAEAAQKQPPNMEGKAAEVEEPKVDFSSMSDEEFEALPESTKRRARGDIV